MKKKKKISFFISRQPIKYTAVERLVLTGAFVVHYFIKLHRIKMSPKKHCTESHKGNNTKAFCNPRGVRDNDFRDTVLLCTKYFFV